MNMVTEFAGRLRKENGDRESYGYCPDLELFKKALIAFPKQELVLRVRNFNDPTDIGVIGLYVPGISKMDSIYVTRKSLTEVLPELTDWVRDALTRSGAAHIPVAEFIDHRNELANILKRPLRLLHMYGSGRQEEASFNQYEAFPE